MNIFHDEHVLILKVLLEHDVDFLLVGGVAVNFYGFPRPTGDLDVWLKPDQDNRAKLVKAMVELNILGDDIDRLRKCDFSQAVVFHLGTTPPFVIDFMTRIAGLDWDDAYKMRVEAVSNDLKVAFLHLNHLKQNKLLAGRPKDQEDLRQLIRIEELKKAK